MPAEPILVIGATGKTGRRVTERLEALGIAVRGVSRSTAIPFDWTDRATWRPALAGTRAAYLTYAPDLALPTSSADIAALAQDALAAGCRQLVLLSGRGEEEAERAEQALIDSGADWTILRCSWFFQNFSEGDFAELVTAGELALPAGDRRAPFVDADDIADAAVAAFTEPERHRNALYDMTGPQSLSHGELVDVISEVTRRRVDYVPITPDEFVAGLQAEGVPAEAAALYAYLFAEVLVDANAGVADGVQRALGRPPRDARTWARDAAAQGAWAERTAA